MLTALFAAGAHGGVAGDLVRLPASARTVALVEPKDKPIPAVAVEALPPPAAERPRGALPLLLSLESWPGAVCLSGALAYTPARRTPDASPMFKSLLLSPALLNDESHLGAGVGAITRF